MSLLMSSCHGYEATVSLAAGIQKAWVFAWFKAPGYVAHRAFVQVSNNTLDGTNDYLSAHIDGSSVIVGGASTSNVDQTTTDPGNFYFYNSPQYGKWTVACAVLDTSVASPNVRCIYGRAAATAVPATTRTIASGMVATQQALTRVFVGRDRRPVTSGTSEASTSDIKLAYIAIGLGDVPTQSQIQSCIDGMHPADLPGVWEYWELKSSGDGLVGVLEGITLAPFGGSATTAWDGADNPTVSAPSGGGTSATANGVTLTATASLIAGSASASTGATATGKTLTATASLITGGGTLHFQAAGMEFGRRTGLGISTFALDAAANYRYTVHADGLVLDSAIITSGVVATDAGGKLPDLVSASIAPGTLYRVHAIRQADGEAATFRMRAQA